MILLVSVGKMKAQSDLLAINTVPVPSSVAAVYATDEKIRISEFMPNETTNSNSSFVSVKCMVPVVLKVKVFNMNGQMAKEETHNLGTGVNEFSVDMNGLAKGMYMVQFYSKEGSAVRRFMKID